MAAVLTGPVTGHYNSTWWSENIGITQNGFTVRRQHFEDEITGDILGDTPIDGIWRGSSMFVDFEMLEANISSSKDAAAADPVGFWSIMDLLLDPYLLHPIVAEVVNTNVQGQVRGVGRLQSSIAEPLIMTESVALNNFPAVITFTDTYIAPGVDYSLLYANRLRTLPLSMKVIPDLTAGLFTFYIPDFIA